MTPTTPVPAAGAAHRADAAVQTVQLDGAELQAALHLAGLSPGTAAPFADLPPASSIEQAVLGSLHAKHVVNGNGVTDLCRGALATLAHPTHRAALYLGSLERWYYMEYYAGPGGLVGYSSDAREHRLTFPCTRDIASGTVEGWLGSLAVPDLPQAHAELEASELSAVAAIVDAWREETLRALLQREQPALARFTREQLVYALDMAAHGDPRWFAGLLARHAPPPFQPDADRLNAGAHALAARGWLAFEDEEVAPAPALADICTGLATLNPYVALNVAAAGVASHSLILAAGVQAYWALRFSTGAEGHGAARLERLGGPGVATLVRQYVALLPAPTPSREPRQASAGPAARAVPPAASAPPPYSHAREAPRARPDAGDAAPSARIDPRRQASAASPAVPGAASQRPRVCTKCGATAAADAKFCGDCGEAM